MNIILEYGKTVTAQDYQDGIDIHPYIPQSDAAILKLIAGYCSGQRSCTRILDLGCGPDRLTSKIAALPGVDVIGLDVSKEFIKEARNNTSKNLTFVCADFLKYNSRKKFDVILLQGVLHHIHGKDRLHWIKKIHPLLAQGGILVIGDEFIPNYKEEKSRRVAVGLFYLHIIGEALRGGSQLLANEESRNLIDDALSGEKGCGYSDSKLLEYIQRQARVFNSAVFDPILPHRRESRVRALKKVYKVLQKIRHQAERIADKNESKNRNRGDYKISMDALKKEIAPRFALASAHTFGPVYSLGGMAVLVFVPRELRPQK